MHSWGSCEGQGLSISRRLQGISRQGPSGLHKAGQRARRTRPCPRCLGRTQARKAGKEEKDTTAGRNRSFPSLVGSETAGHSVEKTGSAWGGRLGRPRGNQP